MRPMFGAFGCTSAGCSIAFVSQASLANGAAAGYGLHKRLEAVRGCRGIGKRDMKLNDATLRKSANKVHRPNAPLPRHPEAIKGPGSRRAPDLPAGHPPAAGAALLPVLT